MSTVVQLGTRSPFPSRLRVSATASWKGVQAAADKGAVAMERVYLVAAKLGREALSLDNLERELNQRDTRGAESVVIEALTTMTGAIETAFPPLVAATLGAGGEAAAKAARTAGGFRAAASRPINDLRFDLVNPEAVKWARNRSGQLVVQITRSTREAVRSLIARSFTEGIPVRQVGVMLRESIGLDERRAQAVANLRERIAASPGGKVWAGKSPIRVPNPVTTAFINAKTKAYAQRLLNQRAHAIARTEAIAASNEGQRQLWMQSVDKGLLFKDELRVWIITGDKRICPVCESSAGDLAPLDKPFPNGYMNPPAHGLCRCAQGISGKRGTKSIQRVPNSPTAALDQALAPGKTDALFAAVPGGNIASDPVLARQVLEGFDARIKALSRRGVKMDLRMPKGERLSRKTWDLNPDTVVGRARIATIDTSIENAAQAWQRLKAAGAVSPEDRMILGFFDGKSNVYAHAKATNRVEINFGQPGWQSRTAIHRMQMSDAAAGFHPVGDIDSILVHEMGHVSQRRRMQEAVDAAFARGERGVELNWRRSVANGWYSREWEEALPRLLEDPDAWNTLPAVIRNAKGDAAYMRNLSREIAREVSRYAQQNTAEFVAETYTGIVYGKKYGDDVMRLYKALGGPEIKGAARTVAPLIEKIGGSTVKKTAENQWLVTLPDKSARTIYFDSRAGLWRDLDDYFLTAPTREELVGVLERNQVGIVVPKAPPTPQPLPKPIGEPKPGPGPQPGPKPEKEFKPIKPIPSGEVGDTIRAVHALRAQELDYTEIARRMGWDVTRRGKGWGKGPQKVFEIIKKFGDPLGRVAPVPLS